MPRVALVLPFLALVLGIAAPAEAQHIDDRRGFWIGVGAGVASARVKCSFCSSDRKLGPSGYIQMGGTPSRHTLVGVEVSYWRVSPPDTTQEYANATAFIIIYPKLDLPFFFKGGFGLGRFAEEDGVGDVLSSTGFSLVLGTGYDFRIAGSFWGAPFVNLILAPSQEGSRNRLGLTSDISQNLLQLGFKVGWH